MDYVSQTISGVVRQSPEAGGNSLFGCDCVLENLRMHIRMLLAFVSGASLLKMNGGGTKTLVQGIRAS